MKRATLRFVSVVFCSALAGPPGLAAQEPVPEKWTGDARDLDLSASQGAPRLMRQRAYGGPGDDTAYDIWPTGDGFAVVGSTAHPERGDLDLLLLHLDAGGELEWGRRIGGAEVEIGFAVRTLLDGTIVVAGWTQSFGAGEGDFWLLGFGPDGALEFSRTFGGPGEERAMALTTTRDGGLALVGETYSHGEGDARFYLVKTDARGEAQWASTYDAGPLHERGLAIIELADGFLLAGNSMDATSGSRAVVSDGLAVRTNSTGEQIWIRRYGGDAHDIVHHVAPLDDGRFLLTGYTQGFDASGRNDIWLVTIDGAGEVLHSAVHGGPQADHNIVARRLGNDLYLVGYSQRERRWEAQVLKLGGAGTIVWDHQYGGPGDEGAVALCPAGPDRMAVVGYTHPPGGSRDVMLLFLER